MLSNFTIFIFHSFLFIYLFFFDETRKIVVSSIEHWPNFPVRFEEKGRWKRVNGSLGEDERNDQAARTSGWELGLAVFRLFIARFFPSCSKSSLGITCLSFGFYGLIFEIFFFLSSPRIG